jgi:putative oxidoreductase
MRFPWLGNALLIASAVAEQYSPARARLNGGRFALTQSIDTSTWVPRVLSVLRVMAALLFLEHGLQKLFGFPPSPNPSPALLSLYGIQGIIEVVGGILLALGLLTRPVAFILCGDMAVAYFMRHAPRDFFPMLNGGDAAILYCFIFLFLATAGGGAWSIDTLRGRS